MGSNQCNMSFETCELPICFTCTCTLNSLLWRDIDSNNLDITPISQISEIHIGTGVNEKTRIVKTEWSMNQPNNS